MVERGLKFVAVSGLGWLLDTAAYLVLVALGTRVLVAGIVGGLCGATFVFITSGRFIFSGRGGASTSKLAAYLAYSLALILLAAWAIEAVTHALAGLAQGRAVSLTLLAFAAKCLVTPFLLATNFVVARAMLHLDPAPRHG